MWSAQRSAVRSIAWLDAFVSRAYDLESQTVLVREILGALLTVRSDLPSTEIAYVIRLRPRDATVVVEIGLIERHRRGGAKGPEPDTTGDRGRSQRYACDDQGHHHNSSARSHITKKR